MNLPITTPSILHKKHDYGNVEGTKYLDAFPRTATDSLAAGFKFGYWGQQEYSPDNVHRPLRSCVGEVKTSSKVTYVSPPVEPYYATVDERRSPSPTRTGSSSLRRDTRSPSPQRQRSKSPSHTSPSPSSRRMRPEAESDVDKRGRSPTRPGAASSASPRRSRLDSHADALYLESMVQQNSNLDRALVLERESRRVLERELREETRARKLLEGSLEEASVSFHRAKDRLRSLGAENEDLRRKNEELLARFAALEQQVADLTLTCRHASQEVDRVVMEKDALHQRLREERQRRRDAEEDRQVLIERFNDAVTRSGAMAKGFSGLEEKAHSSGSGGVTSPARVIAGEVNPGMHERV